MAQATSPVPTGRRASDRQAERAPPLEWSAAGCRGTRDDDDTGRKELALGVGGGAGARLLAPLRAGTPGLQALLGHGGVAAHAGRAGLLAHAAALPEGPSCSRGMPCNSADVADLKIYSQASDLRTFSFSISFGFCPLALQ